MPLADELRPETLDDIVGQSHILGQGKALRKIIESGQIPNLIFFGPPGIGKTTVAKMIAKYSDKQYYKLNGTTASLSDIKAIMAESESIYATNGIILYLDEIQYLNKKQQQSLLEYIEVGKITLIASTTENPYFYVYNALLSRSAVFEFKPIKPQELLPAIDRAYRYLEKKNNITFSFAEGIKEYIASRCGGDVRKALNTVELSYFVARDGSDHLYITQENVEQLIMNVGMNFDKDGDQHYDLLSGLQKSIRGSDPDAAVFYLAKLLNGGDLISPCRRLMIIACEDIGMAYPQAISIVKSCVDSALQVGLPEARIILAQAAIVLATAPKSNSAYLAIAKAMEDINKGKGAKFPRCIQNVHYDGIGDKKGQNYIYPHDYVNDYVTQQYLPDDLKDAKYYIPSQNKHEQQIENYWKHVKGQKDRKK